MLVCIHSSCNFQFLIYYLCNESLYLHRVRLREYEQACAVDSVTRKCAGPTSECRNAIIHILGTKLRFFCGCNGTDVIQLYDCLDWQRILWVNPCVGKWIGLGVGSHLVLYDMISL